MKYIPYYIELHASINCRDKSQSIEIDYKSVFRRFQSLMDQNLAIRPSRIHINYTSILCRKSVLGKSNGSIIENKNIYHEGDLQMTITPIS